jgi:DNA-binding XRE family transcriptional regulator
MASTRGTIYAIGTAGTSSVKIGKTAGAVTKRLAALQTAHPFPLKVLASVPVEHDVSRIEKAIHHFLEAERQHGEWFAVSLDQPQLEALILRAVEWLAEESARQAAESAPRLAQGPSTIKSIPQLGKRIQALREKRGLSIQALADQAQTSYQNIWRIEHGYQLDPSVALVRDIAQAMGVGLDYLVNMFAEDAEGAYGSTARARV